MNKCTGIMGWVFGHKLKACVFYQGDLIVAKNMSTLEIADLKERHGVSSDCRISLICQRCGAIAGEKK